MRKIRRILSLMLIAGLCFILSIKADATSFSASTSKNTVTPGESFTVTLNASGLTGRFDVSGTNCTVSPSKIWVEKGVPDSKITVKAGGEGTAKVTITAQNVADLNRNDVTGSTEVKITVKSAQTNGDNTGDNGGSNNNNDGNSNNSNNGTTTTFSTAELKMITTSPVDFKGFKSASSGPYKVTVENDVTSINVAVSKKENGQKVSISGNQNLDVGTNKVTVSVTSADGKNKMTYVIYVTRKSGDSENTEEKPNQIDNENNKEEKEKLGLSAIILDEGYSLTPEFKTDIYEYTVNINEDLKEFPVNAISTQDDAKIEITGNTDLIDGENTITIKVISADGNETVVYTIKVIKEKIETTQIEKKIQATPTYYNAYESIKNTSMIVTVIIGIVFFVAITSAIAEFRTYSKKLNVCKLEKTSKDNFNYGETIGEVNIEEVKPKKHKGKHF